MGHHLLNSLKFQRANAAYYKLYMQNTSLKVWKPETSVLHINSAAYKHYIFKLFEVIFSSIQLSKILKLVMANH